MDKLQEDLDALYDALVPTVGVRAAGKLEDILRDLAVLLEALGKGVDPSADDSNPGEGE